MLGLIIQPAGASPIAAITSGSITGLTTLALRNAGTGAYDLTLACNGTMTAGRALTIDPGNAAQSLIFTGASTITFPSGTATLAKLAANTFTGQQIVSLNGAASTPPLNLTGTWFTGGNATTTKPAFLIEPAGTTSAAWHTSGTGLGLNAPSGFVGNFWDCQIGGSSRASLRDGGGGLIFFNLASWMDVVLAGSYTFRFGGPSLQMFQTENIQLIDMYLYRDAANVSAFRNAANACTTRVANTWTSETNYEFGVLDWQGAANVFRVGTQKGSGGGTARDMVLITDDTERIRIKASGAVLFEALPTSDPGISGQFYKDPGTGAVFQSA